MCAYTRIYAYSKYVYSLKFALILIYKKAGEGWVKKISSVCNSFCNLPFFLQKKRTSESFFM